MTSIAGKLDTLLSALQEKGIDPAQNLNPGLSEQEIEDGERELGFPFPAELKQLYAWRNGNADSGAEVEEMLCFRDMPFLSIEDALDCREELKEFAAAYESSGLSLPFDPRKAFPFAALEGQYYVVACGDHEFADAGERPVIAAGEDLAPYFCSVQTMLDTCIAWVKDPEYTAETLEPEDEMQAWTRFNPGLMDEDV